MSFNPRQARAVAHYLTEHPGLRLSLQGTPGTVYMVDKSTGKAVTADINLIVERYDRDRKEATKERARVRRLEKKGAKR